MSAPLTNDTMFLTAARNAAEEVFAKGLHKAMLVKASQVLALVECAEALTVTRGQWIHSVNAPRCLAALAKLEAL